MRKEIVIIDTSYYSVAQTGIRTYIRQLVELTKSSHADRLDFRITHGLQQQSGSKILREYGMLSSFLLHAYTLWWKQVWLPILLIRSRADILICPDYHAPLWKLKVKKLVVFHDAFFWENPTHYNQYWLRYFKWMIIQGLRGDTHVISVSQASTRKLLNHIPSTVKIETIPSPAPSFPDKNIATDSLRAFEISPKEYILHVGVFEKRKNLKVLIKAFADLISDGDFPNLKLVLAGIPGPKRDLDDFANVKDQINALDLGKRVRLTGHVSQESLAALYQHALIYAFPSRNEGFGFPILEAFGYGVPVMISNEEALMEVGAEAVMVADMKDPREWENKLRRILSDSDLRESLIKGGKQRLNDFSFHKFGSSMEDLIMRVDHDG